MERDKLGYLAEFIRIRNVADHSIAKLIGRPGNSGHIAEFIASKVFDIELHVMATQKATDGYFRSGPYKDRTVNVKYSSRNSGTLDLVGSLDPADHANVYLVMTGPRSDVVSSRNTVTPWVVTDVYLFKAELLLERLALHGVKLGTSTSVRKDVWKAAGIYPGLNPSLYPLSSEQRLALELFGPVFDQD